MRKTLTDNSGGFLFVFLLKKQDAKYLSSANVTFYHTSEGIHQ
jgi:hypothetical protein